MKNQIIKSINILLFITLIFCGNVLIAQNVIKGPYLIEPGYNKMVIRYEFDSKVENVLEYGVSKKSTNEIKLIYRESKHDGYLYSANIEGLESNSTYYYRLKGDSEWFTFKTFKPNQSKLSFVAMGDSRSNPDIFTRIMKGTVGVNPDFIISMGDLVEIGGDYDQWQEFYFSVVKGYVESTPIVSTLGDHETNGDEGDLFRYFLRTDETVDKQWFSFSYGDAHFISLDYRYPDNQQMIDWFIKDVASANKKWNFVYLHRPSYNFGGHRTDWGRDIWPDLFLKNKIDIVFTGHSHLYERFYPVRPAISDDDFAVTYITTGGAGAGLYESVKNKSILAVSESVNHFVDVKIDGNTLNMTTIKMDGSILDEFEIIKSKKGYNKEFEDVVISQEQLNTITGFNSAISHNLTEVPLYSRPARFVMELNSVISEDIPFSVEIMDVSKEYYRVESFLDTLKAQEKKEVYFDVYRLKDFEVSAWGGFKPELRMRLIYEYNSEQDTIISKAINYWPGKY